MRATRSLRRGLAAVAAAAVLLPVGGATPAAADVSSLKGSAFGAFVKVSLFGGEPSQVGAAPTVELPPTGGEQARKLPSLIGQFGPATIFGGQYQDPGRNPSGELSVSTKGKTGPDGFVTSDASVVNIGPGPLIADKMSSTCTAKESGVTASATITKGIVETSYDTETQEPKTTRPVPEKPAPNTAIEGTIDHVGDRFRIVFNEQIVNGNTITVRAAHMYLLGDIAIGDSIIGESVCGITGVTAAAPTTTAAPATTAPTTVPEPTTVPTTQPATTAVPTTDRRADLDAKSITSESDGNGALVLVGVAAGVIALGTFVGIRRRRRRPV